MRFYCLILVMLFLINARVCAQYQEYARQIVHVLASDSLHGRGYVNDGDKKAADYIRKEFINVGLEPINGTYYQPFNIPINTFPDSIFLSIDGKKLNVGEDFHVLPGSPGLNGEFDIIFVKNNEIFDLEILRQKLIQSKGKVLVLDEYPDSLLDTSKQNRLNQIVQFLTRHPNNEAAATILLTSKKINWYGSQVEDANTSLYLDKASFDTSSQRLQIHLNNEFINNYQTQNIFGFLEGSKSDSVIIVMAHYDHFGRMGQALFPGANDNASGVAMMLSLAKYYSENRPTNSMLFVAFGAEELGLIGSKYFVDHPPIRLEKTKFILNFDLAGTGDDGIQVVNGSVYRSEFDRLVRLNEEYDLLPEVRIRGAACNSDHCNFDNSKISGFYIYTLGGIRAYHDIYDRAETLPLTEFEDYHTLITLFIDSMQ